MTVERKKILWTVVAPVVVVIAGVIAAFTMLALKPDVETRPPSVVAPLVRVAVVDLESRVLTVSSQGTVSPRTESQLVPEVAGRVIWVSDSFASGGFFEKGEALVKIDPFDYDQALVTARSELARSKVRLAQEEAEGLVARREWEELGRGDGTPLTLRKPQLEDARAAVDAAVANVERAERNRERTVIQAPYAGRIRQKSVDVGQFVTVGAPIATIYAVDAAEVRLPLPDDDLAFVSLPMTYRGGAASRVQPSVVISASFAGERHEWNGRIVRTEGEIDPATRMIHAVARIDNPYAPGDNPRRPPLNAGMFVHAEIEGRQVEGVAVLPRAALRSGSRIWVVDEQGRLRYRDVTVLRATATEVVVSEGLEDGELVVLSPLDATTDGMEVRTADEEGRSL
jgi:RND family efflux transporter MFP subunit